MFVLINIYIYIYKYIYMFVLINRYISTMPGCGCKCLGFRVWPASDQSCERVGWLPPCRQCSCQKTC